MRKRVGIRRRADVRKRTEIWKRIASAVSSFGSAKLSPIGLLILFVQLFIWFSELFLTNNIKTNKVVRKTFTRKLREL